MAYRMNQTTFDEMGRLSIRLNSYIDFLDPKTGGKVGTEFEILEMDDKTERLRGKRERLK